MIDRHYFRSVYFREPSGVLFEIATIGPGLHGRRAARAPRREAVADAAVRAPARPDRADADAAAQPARQLVPSAIGRPAASGLRAQTVGRRRRASGGRPARRPGDRPSSPLAACSSTGSEHVGAPGRLDLDHLAGVQRAERVVASSSLTAPAISRPPAPCASHHWPTLGPFDAYRKWWPKPIARSSRGAGRASPASGRARRSAAAARLIAVVEHAQLAARRRLVERERGVDPVGGQHARDRRDLQRPARRRARRPRGGSSATVGQSGACARSARRGCRRRRP